MTVDGATLIRLTACITFLLCSSMACAQKRHALVIGNDTYPGNQLKNARNDAKAVYLQLVAAGYASTLILDVDRASLSTKIDSFMDTLHPGDTAILYYAGHGFQLDGENYLVPVDFTVATPATARSQGYSLSSVLERFTSHGAITQIVILDACRDNPFMAARSLKGGWAGLGTSAGSFLAFGTSPGSTSSDDPAGAHGLFTKDLLKYLTTSNQDIEEMFRKVREDVIRDSGGQQIPWIASSLIGTFHLRPELDDNQPILVGFKTIADPPTLTNGSASTSRAFSERHLENSERLSLDEARSLDRAVTLIRATKINEAIGVLKDILAIHPAFAIASRLLGLLLHLTSRDIEATRTLSQSIQANPKDAIAAAYLCAIEGVSEQAAALSDCEGAARLQPTSQTRLVYAAKLHGISEDQKAIAEVSDSILLEPSGLAYALRGLIEWGAGDRQAAEADFSKASLAKTPVTDN